MTDERNAELFFSCGGEECRLTFQWLDSSRDRFQPEISVILQKNGDRKWRRDEVKEMNPLAERNGRPVQMETVMLESLRTLNSADDLETGITHILELVTRFYDGERSYIIEIDREQGYSHNAYEWCRDGVPAQIYRG